MTANSWLKLVPDGIAARTALTVVLAVLLTQAVSALVYLTDRGHDRPMHSPSELTQRMVAVVQLVEGTQPQERPRVVHALNPSSPRGPTNVFSVI